MGWPQFRGVNRDGRVSQLPDRLPHLERDLRWVATLTSHGVGGLAANDEIVIISGRDAADEKDRFTALDLRTGKQLWLHEYDAQAELDYGNSPRATPVIVDGVVVTLGATGILSALDASTGVPLWSVELTKRFATPVPTWGFSGSPLVIDGVIYLQVCKEAAVAAIDLFSGETKWQVAGETSAYSSLVSLENDQFVVGVQPDGYFVRRTSDGALVWSFTSEFPGDFGVPSPVPTKEAVIFIGENNGVQLVPRKGPKLNDVPHAIDDTLIPDSHTPVLVGSRLLVAYDGLHALDITDGLKEVWNVGGAIITGYASIIASSDRALVTTEKGRLVLVDFGADIGKVIDQRQLSQDNVAMLSHPVVLGGTLLIRVGDEVRCYRLSNAHQTVEPGASD